MTLSRSISLFALILVFSSSIQAQDTISYFKKFRNQYNAERNFKSNMYYNPAAMSDYSPLSFSEFGASYHSDHKNMYREPLGSGSKGVKIFTNSYQRLNPKRSVWGSASYEKLTSYHIKWNENLDYDRVAPYILADSVGGHLQLERYSFSGGYSETMKRFTLGIKAGYTAQLGYRAKDPRINNTTSDLSLDFGINYTIFSQYQVGIFTRLNKYTQNSSISFVSLLGKPYTYQMTGLGHSNNFFNGTTNSMAFEELGYKIGLQIGNASGTDFYLQAMAGSSENTKHIQINNPYYETSDLDKKQLIIEGAKFFSFSHHRLGLLGSYSSSKDTGTEYGYSINTQLVEKIFSRQTYQKENYSTMFKLMYQYACERFTINAVPFLGSQEIKESRLYPVSGQKFDYLFLGIDADFQYKLNERQVLTLQPYFSKRHVRKSINALSDTGNESINHWLAEDYQFQASGTDTFGSSLRYDAHYEKWPVFFISVELQSQKIQQNNNNFVSTSIGITF